MPSLHPAPHPSPSDPARVSELYTLLEPVAVRADSPRARFTNWGLSFSCTPLAVFEPATEAQCEHILELARLEKKTVRVVGCGHSPSDLACTSGFMLRTERLDKVIEVCPIVISPFAPLGFAQSSVIRRSPLPPSHPIGAVVRWPALSRSLPVASSTPSLTVFPPQVNRDKRYVLCQAGITLNTLHAVLADHGLAMPNLGSISEQTIGGVITTATHGTGFDFPVLSMGVLSLVILLADGSRVRCSRTEHSDLFLASLCGLGSTGLILQVQLQVGPAFRLKEVQESHTFDDALRNMDMVARSAEHVRYWWFPQADVVRTSVFNKTHEVRTKALRAIWP